MWLSGSGQSESLWKTTNILRAGTCFPPSCPRVIRRVVEETGCGLLLNLGHARLAAHYLGTEVREHVAALPIAHIREFHLSGVQRFEGNWLKRASDAGIDADTIRRFAGRQVEHLPMTERDWALAAWAMGQIHSRAWGGPGS